MGNPKQKWTSEEEEALRKGILKHGTGKWKDIQRDPEFNPFLLNRSNIDLKDKWRNLSCSANGQGPREKVRTPKPKSNPDAPVMQPPAVPQTANIAQDTRDASEAVPPNLDDSSKGLSDGKNSSMYNSMIFEAISALNEPNGSDTATIVNFIEQKHEVPPNFRRLLSTRLRRLVAQDKLEKVQNNYKLKKAVDVQSAPKTPAPSVENQPRQLQNSVAKTHSDPQDEVAISAAYKIAEAENKAFVAAEAVKEAERVVAVYEETEAVLKFAQEIHDKCSRGEVVYPA